MLSLLLFAFLRYGFNEYMASVNQHLANILMN